MPPGASYYEFDASNALLIIRGDAASASDYDPLKELSTGAIPAGVSGDTISFLGLAAKLG